MAFSSYNERDRRRQAFQLGIGATAAGMLAVPGFRRPAVRSLAAVLASAGNFLGRATPPPGIASTAAELEGMLARNGAPEVAALARQELLRRLEAPNAFRDPVGWAGRHLGRLFGVRATTLGEAVGGNTAAPWAAGAHAYLGGLIGTKAAEGLPVGGLYTVGGQVFDFRGLQDVGQRVGRFFSQEFQIPIVPGFEGVSPGQLFPWLRGGTGRTFQEVRSATHGAFGELRPNRDPVLNALLGPIQSEVESQFPQATPEWLAEWRVLKVGDRYAAAWGGGVDPAGNLQAQVVRELPVEGTLRSALHGQMRGRTEQVLAAQEARAAGGRTPWQWLGLGRQYGKSALQERLGFLTKFRKESDWAPSVLGRVVGKAIPSPVGATPEELLASRAGIAREFGHDLRRTGRFLTSQPLPGKVEQALLAEGEKLLPGSFPELLAAARAPTDQGILDFFTGVRTWEEQQGARRIWKSEGLRHLYNEFRESPQGFLGRLKPHAPGSLGQKLLGGRPTESAFDLTRRALFDELEELVSLQGGGDAGFRDLLSGLELSAAEREAALGYASGKQILRRLGGFESTATAGVPWEERRWRQAEETLGWLRDPGQAEVRTAAEAYTRRFTGILDAAPHDAASQLGTSALLLPKARGFLEEFNRARAGGANFLEAMGQTATGPAARQYGAFFTGKAKDFTERTLALEYYPRKLNQLFAGAGLGLPAEDLLSGGSIFKGLFLKRILPAVAAYELYRYADYKQHSAGAPGPSDLYAGARSQAGLARARVFGRGGLFERFVGRRELFPGLDQWLPERGVEEEALHQESGLEPVRKGRWWLFGSKEEARGGKIDYFLPSAVSVARSRWQETDSSDLNTREHWAHSWIPLPENNFLGPLNWLTDRYWWEKRHSEGPNPDRPYLVSGKPFDPHTLHGGILNPLLGGLIKPQRLLYPEYVPQSAGGDAAKEQLRRINESLRSGADRGGIAALVGGSVTGVTGRGGGLGAPGVGTGGGAEELGSLLTISPGGMLTTETLPGGTSGSDFAAMGRSTIQREGHGERLSRTELRRINRATKAGLGGGLPVRASTFSRLASQTTPFSDAELDLIDTESGGIAGTKNLQDIMGLYGWMSRLLYNPKQQGPVIADPSRAYGYARRFHELGLGGLGGELSEVGRRFLRRPDRIEPWNPVRNDQPSWLPGGEYFIDFQHGDPYIKVPRGELRLPGAAYEATHPVGMLRTRASSLGKSVPELMQEMLFLEQPMSAYGEEVTGIGTALHKKIQRRWRRMGILETAEQTLENKALGITGHLDAILRVNGERQVAEIKTVGEKRFRQAERRPFEEHLDQINFYLHETHLAHGMVLYVNRDRPDQIAMHRIGFSPGRFRRTVDRVEDARRQLLGMVDRGTLNRGDLYDPVSRFEILSDVAPYSANYSQVREYLTRKNGDGQLSESDNARFQAAKKRVAEQKRHLALYPYRFRNVALTERSYTVDRILDPNTFTVRESENPIRLAGLKSSQERIEAAYGEAPEGKSLAEHQFDQFGIRPGARVRVAVDADPLRRVADDTLQTQHAVVYGRGGNVNRQLIASGVGTEKETDWSSPGVAARFDPAEIRKGAAWEWFAHLDTPFHNKFLRTRSPLEELERGIVYGKNTGGWNNLASDYLWPTLASYAARHPVLAGLSTGAFASFFFRSRGAKLLAAGIGAGVGAALSLGRAAGEAITGEAWKPGWTRKREELEEYWDALKYVKARGLAARYEQLAKAKEGVDVEKIARDSYRRGEQNKRRKNWLEKRKRELLRQGGRGEEVAPELAQVQSELQGLSGERAELGERHRSISERIHASVTAFPEDPEQRTGLRQDLQKVQQKEAGLRERRKALLARKAELVRAGAGRDEVARIQDDLDRLNQPIGVEKLGPYATRALAYREAFRSTLYGIDPGQTPFINLFRAFPKYKRELISPAIEKSSEEERRRIFALLPRAEQRVLGRYLGARDEEIPDRPRLSEFFQEHPLPDAGWRGWSEEVDLESLRQRAVRSERLDPFQSGLYNEQIDDAEERTRGISVPTLRGSTADLKNTLNALLSGHGLQQVRVAVDLQPHDGDRDDVRFDIEISQKRERDLASALQLHG